METEMYNTFKQNMCDVIHTALKFRFQNIKGLVVTPSETGVQITCDNDGDITEEAIELFLEQLKQSAFNDPK